LSIKPDLLLLSEDTKIIKIFMKKSFRFYYLGLILFIIALAIPTFISASVEVRDHFDILKAQSKHFNITNNEVGG
jgi:hypothetical protein